MHLYYANTIAADLVSKLEPFCELINVAGSVRRKKEEVKDIEIVCIAKRTEKSEINLFGEVINESIGIHPGFENTIRSAGKILKGKFTGRYMQVAMPTQIEGMAHLINIDLFMPQQHDYYRQLAIRTGSAEYSKRLANKWVKRGYRGTPDGLRKQSECYQIGDKWFLLKEKINTQTSVPAWKSEEDFFRWLGVQYIDPKYRNL